ncbi:MULTISPECIES: lysozyme inhibitor LprI family protein [Cupriavidus]
MRTVKALARSLPAVFALAVPLLAMPALAADVPGIADAGDAVLAGDARAAREACGTGSQADMRDCLAGKAHASEHALKQAEQRAVAALAAWDEDAKYATAAVRALRASGAAFARYRDAQCEFATALGGGAAGNTREILGLACVAALNAQRARQLGDAVADLPPR